jgi:hypothetical protein
VGPSRRPINSLAFYLFDSGVTILIAAAETQAVKQRILRIVRVFMATLTFEIEFFLIRLYLLKKDDE